MESVVEKGLNIEWVKFLSRPLEAERFRKSLEILNLSKKDLARMLGYPFDYMFPPGINCVRLTKADDVCIRLMVAQRVGVLLTAMDLLDNFQDGGKG